MANDQRGVKAGNTAAGWAFAIFLLILTCVSLAIVGNLLLQ